MMTQEQLAHEAGYGAVMANAAAMLKMGIITEKDYRAIDTKMRRKWRPIISELLPQKTPSGA
jgi:hypothetical protein